ncbi:hypothetical protein P171DRAFT_190736 [Karstenula rhodostoma CBS 690.94]|uniref:MARVEL domain-containing protein n=1 Tax=Karstenula rhodostoma CBS 690.94 TaxID=1392251 RepID=A0A9P4UGM8_9PLEO|nr:hypothetical protein P171DRAFT_190736 [Karstenula rhodostoma CBS 690.94]
MAKPTIDWRKRILLPLWAIRICMMLVVVIGFSMAMGSSYDDVRYPAAVTFLFFTVLVLLLDVVQIILWSRDRLYPVYFAGLTIFQAAFWGLVLLMDIISVANNQQNPRAVGLVVVVFLLYLSSFSYALRSCVKQRRLSKRGHYAPANDAGTPAVAEIRYSESTFDRNDKHYHSPMYRGGDLGEIEPLHTENDGPVDHYVDRPRKFATVV